jgi:transposase-like protein
MSEQVRVDDAVIRWVIPGLISSYKTDGRAVYSEQGKAALVQLVRLGQASLPVIARANGVNHNLVHKWVKGGQVKTRSTKPAAIQTPRSTVSLIPVKLAQPSPNFNTNVVVQMPNGTVSVEACSVEYLQVIMKHLSGAR